MTTTQQKKSMFGLLAAGLLAGIAATILYYLVKAKNATTTAAKNTLAALTGSLSDIPTNETPAVEYTAAQTDAVLKGIPLKPVRLYEGEVFKESIISQIERPIYLRAFYKEGIFFKITGDYYDETLNTPVPVFAVPSGDGNTIFPTGMPTQKMVKINTEQDVIDKLFKKKDYYIARLYIDKDENFTGGQEHFLVNANGTSKRLPIVDNTKKGLSYSGGYKNFNE
jgi:hypothetical protein